MYSSLSSYYIGIYPPHRASSAATNRTLSFIVIDISAPISLIDAIAGEDYFADDVPDKVTMRPSFINLSQQQTTVLVV